MTIILHKKLRKKYAKTKEEILDLGSVFLQMQILPLKKNSAQFFSQWEASSSCKTDSCFLLVVLLRFLLLSIDRWIRGQFHRHFTSSFHAWRSQKLKQETEESQVKQLFALFGPALVKAARKHIDEIDPGCGSYVPGNSESANTKTVILGLI